MTPCGQVGDEADPVDDLLAGRPVVGPVGELALDVVQAGDRGAPEVLQAGHPVQGGLDRDADQPLHLLGAEAGVLRDDLDQRRGRVGIGLDVQFPGRMDAHGDQREAPPPITSSRLCKAPEDDESDHESRSLRAQEVGGSGRLGRSTMGTARRPGTLARRGRPGGRPPDRRRGVTPTTQQRKGKKEAGGDPGAGGMVNEQSEGDRAGQGNGSGDEAITSRWTIQVSPPPRARSHRR